jgi:hypothetical protein
MKQFIPQINVCFMALVVLTSMSFTVDVRYCGDTLVDFHLSSKRNLWYGYERHDSYQ